jgi:nitrite reductase/ring-hydroxylating ferredoxin subunit
MSAEWHKVANAADVPGGGALQVSVGNELIAVYNLEGRFYATADICTHRYALLSDGFIEGDTIECPLHQAVFHIPTGKVLSEPAYDDLKTYPVQVKDGAIYVGL